MKTADQKRAAAIAYLRSRGLYVLDRDSPAPRPAVETDVARTCASYRRQVLAQPFPAVIRRRGE